MFRNTNVQNLWTNQRGAVAVEFGLIALVLIFFIMFLVDLMLQQALVGKLDRVTYSVAGTLRERTQLYGSDEYLSQEQAEQAVLLAKKTLQNMHSDADLSKLSATVEELHFVDLKLLSSDRKEISRYNRYHVGAASCEPYSKLDTLQELSPKGSYNRWVPMYQVTLCLPSASWFKKLTDFNSEGAQQKSFAIVVVR
ncbi:tight adherence pilus pseudopilin TadF [Leminorella grimontii]|uniref:tight adherence pilus pseudopilin TadF n=1 Tax=Leminorella grimontii TaxID=82981 RepID=UPI0004812CD0|nr:tight adherence pilus pseudopilin TadF [Leminorella grimontii]VFS61545.1 Flp pilus assembly protein TadG [Leminorella grimontii]